MSGGKNSKESFEYFMKFYALKEDIREVSYFQYYYYLEIHKLFKDPYCRSSMEMIAHMVDEVCKKVGTRWLPLGAKREDSSKPSACPSSRRMFGFSSNRASKSCELSTTQDEEASSSLKKKRNEVEAMIPEVECKSLH